LSSYISDSLCLTDFAIVADNANIAIAPFEKPVEVIQTKAEAPVNSADRSARDIGFLLKDDPTNS
jgi:hypothetical protein